MTGDAEFWAKAYACLQCGKKHTMRTVETKGRGRIQQTTWAAPEDGHTYRTIIPLSDLLKFQEYMTKNNKT